MAESFYTDLINALRYLESEESQALQGREAEFRNVVAEFMEEYDNSISSLAQKWQQLRSAKSSSLASTD